ncbi:hypothetical protein [Streptomyces agglomeratus]|uniref:hypothetical protein n=1 Tax=Streptomyces agglomeratus TaxID=285458 RepID=UPI0009A0640D|nr:hypothetical protein [Streptomyces agglomeratus]
MSEEYEEIAELQAGITRLLLHHVSAPLVGTQYVRGILPVPPPAEAIRVVTGIKAAHTAEQLTAYEMPLRVEGELVTGDDIAGILRALHSGTRVYPSDSIDTVMGMTLVHVHPATVPAPAPAADDNALIILRTLALPYTEEEPDPRLRGFLFLDEDRLRLYLDAEDIPGVTAVDVRPSGALTALLAALPSLITEKQRMTENGDDPHCSNVVDLTDW